MPFIQNKMELVELLEFSLTSAWIDNKIHSLRRSCIREIGCNHDMNLVDLDLLPKHVSKTEFDMII